MKPQILIDIVEVLTSDLQGVDEEVFEQIVQIFIRHGMTIDDLQECYGINEALDNVIDEYKITTDDDYDDDGWPDGGREDF